MKKYIALFFVLAVLAGCRTDRYELVIPMSGIGLNEPAEGTLVDLNDMNVEKVTFVWDKAVENGATIIFSDSRTLKNQVTVAAGTGVSHDILPMDMNQISSQLGIMAGRSGMLYWTVKASDRLADAASSVYTINVNRIKSRLIAPEDQSSVELLVERPEETVLFSWDGDGQEGDDYAVCMSLDPNMVNNVKEIPVTASDASAFLTADQIQTAVESMDINRFSQNQVYWNIRNIGSGKMVSRSSGLIMVKDMLRFTDVRGEGEDREVEQYRVVKLEYNDKTMYWLAENLRTTHLPDGTSLERNVEYQECGDNYLTWCGSDEEKAAARRAYGKYYTLEAALRTVPAGWKLPTWDDWRELYDAAGQAGSYILLKSPSYYVPADKNAEKADEYWGKWGLDLVPAGQWWGGSNAGGDGSHSQHLYLLADECQKDSWGTECGYFVQSAADSNFWPQPVWNGGNRRGASVRLYYIGK